MSFFHNQLREYILSKFMTTSASVSSSTMENTQIDESLKKDIEEQEEPQEIISSEIEDESVEPREFDKTLETKNREFFYLLDDPLTKEFSFNRDLTQNYTLYLCCYKMNKVLDMPFLEFYLEKIGLEYEFPNKILYADVFKQDLTNAENIKDIDDIFVEQCSLFLKEKTNMENLEEYYKGFIEQDKKIIAVFDCTDLTILDTEERTISQNWAILEEILDKGSIVNTPMSLLVIDSFKNNKILCQIQTRERESIPVPRILYMCEKNGDEYKNTYFNEDETNFNTITVMNGMVNHPILRDVYLFSRKPIDETNVNKIKRFVLFINEKILIKGELLEANIPEEPVIGFIENEKEFWCTKSPKFFTEP